MDYLNQLGGGFSVGTSQNPPIIAGGKKSNRNIQAGDHEYRQSIQLPVSLSSFKTAENTRIQFP